MRAVGEEDLELVWVHDGIERNGVSVYLEGEGPFPAEREVQLIRFADLRPGGSSSDGGDAGWSVTWVAGPAGSPNHNPAQAAANGRVGIGMTALAPGETLDLPGHGGPRLAVVIAGTATVEVEGGPTGLGPLDALHCQAAAACTLGNRGSAPLWVLWVDEAGRAGG
ncbi:cupin domain-containing protein [Roseicella aquatilis]|uniref:Cupin domain-containing protein n=1 Tax=Roseicella aquatilis TaxID=2527868 RepID=A0A4R4D558_9PROT|nr:hypothetical protein [Roseicella aquatilis]TCZ51108.1 hypothetical protein EXY23_27075 [Roseicella aquatilis]